MVERIDLDALQEKDSLNKDLGIEYVELEGAVMLSRLYDDPAYMKRSVDHLKEHLRSLAWDPERSGA